MKISVRNGTLLDVPAIVALFQQSVIEATAHDYDEHQRRAWAARGANVARWEGRIRRQHFLLAEQSDQLLLGFGSITPEGYLDVLYVHHAHQGGGIATLLLTALETWAKRKGVRKIMTDASLTARPFFKKHAYVVKKEQQNWLEDVMLVNFRMEKTL